MDKENISKFSNKQISHLLRSISAAYLIKNMNRFRIIAYQNAADTVEKLTREIRDIWQEGNIENVPGVGKSIAQALDEYFKKGYSKHFEQALSGVPATTFELMKVPSIGPKKAHKLVEHFNLVDKNTVFKDLKKLCKQNKIAELESFGKKSQDAILSAIVLFEKRVKIKERMPLPYADRIANEVVAYLKKNKKVKRVDALGSLRRKVATIGDVDVAIAAKDKDAKEIVDHFLKYPKKIAVDNAGIKKASIILAPDIRVDLRVQSETNYGPMLQYFTGSKNHNILIRDEAKKRGLSLSEYGIKDVKSTKMHKFKTEEDFYKFLGYQYIPPEIREGTNELDLARNNRLPKLVELNDIKGDFHVHTSYPSQQSHDYGKNSYLEMYKKAVSLGYQYIGFTDHNTKISDLTTDQINRIMKKKTLDVNRQLSRQRELDYYIGVEADILPDGRIAVPNQSIEYLDYVLVAVHSVFNMDTQRMTKRVLRALDFPKVKILGHPTGRLLGKREGYELEWAKVFAKCRQKSIAVEINSWPERLDLVDTLVREALKHKVKFVINTDAHADNQMDNMLYGVSVARRGWATNNDIINTLEKKQLKKWMGVIK